MAPHPLISTQKSANLNDRSFIKENDQNDKHLITQHIQRKAFRHLSLTSHHAFHWTMPPTLPMTFPKTDTSLSQTMGLPSKSGTHQMAGASNAAHIVLAKQGPARKIRRLYLKNPEAPFRRSGPLYAAPPALTTISLGHPCSTLNKSSGFTNGSPGALLHFRRGLKRHIKRTFAYQCMCRQLIKLYFQQLTTPSPTDIPGRYP